MKRFYCTECKKIKHVRNLPKNVVSPNALDPKDRQGKCNHHDLSKLAKHWNNWTFANELQAEGRFNRTNSVVEKVR